MTLNSRTSNCYSFDLRARVGRDCHVEYWVKDDNFCFNPRAREGRDTSIINLIISKTIVSIHAPVKGATYKGKFVVRRSMGFNPRAREGRDGAAHRDCRAYGLVSIHAPVKGATIIQH